MAKDPELSDVVREATAAFASLGRDFREAFGKQFEEAQYRFDKELGTQLAKHPELYAELKRGYRGLRRGMDKLAGDLGLK